MKVTLSYNSLLYYFQSPGEIKKGKTNIFIPSLRNNDPTADFLFQQNKTVSLWLYTAGELKDFAQLNWDASQRTGLGDLRMRPSTWAESMQR